MTLSHTEFVDRINKILPNIEIVGAYTKATDRVQVRCKVCGKEWSPKAYSLSQGKGCPHCSAINGAKVSSGKTRLKTESEFRQQLLESDNTIVVLDDYVNTHTPVKCKCLRCGNIWTARPYSLLQGHGCPRCVKSGTSFMEQFILECFRFALGKEKVLSRDRTAIGMELDIYIPSLKVAIEPGNWNLHKRNIDRDYQKRYKSIEQGITLYTIYDMFPSETKPPFCSNCITFDFDLNKADHKYLRELVYDLFEELNINKSFSDVELEEIERLSKEASKCMTTDEFVSRMEAVNPDIQIMGSYETSNKRINVRCKQCGYEWAAVPSSLLSGDGCRKCGTIKAHEKFLKSHDDFVRSVNKINPNVEVVGQYMGRHNPVHARCKICGYEWDPIASSLLRGSSHKGAIKMHRDIEQ